MSTTDIAQSFMGELIAEIWNRTNAESTGVYMIPSDSGGFKVVDTTGKEWIRTVNALDQAA